MKKRLTALLYTLAGLSALAGALVLWLPGYAGVGPALAWAYILLGIAVLLAVAFPLMRLSSDARASKRSFIMLGAIVAVVALAWALSSAEPVTLPEGRIYDSAAGLRLADVALYTAYFLLAVAVAVAVWGALRNVFNRDR